MKGLALADSDCDEDDWGSVWTVGKFELLEEDEGKDLRNDDGDKHDDNCDDDDDDDDDDNKKSCKALMIDFDSLIFPFSLVI